MHSLQTRLRYAIMSPMIADGYAEHEGKPGCSVPPFCGICRREGRKDSLFCSACHTWAFNHHWAAMPALDRKRLGFVGNDYLPPHMRESLREIDYALVYMRRALRDAKNLEAAGRV